MFRPSRLALTLVAVVALASGCDKKLGTTVIPNQPPEISLTQAPTSTTQPYHYAYEMFWSGYDPDGRIAYYLYAVDPPPGPNADTAWVRTTANRQVVVFRSDDADSLGTLTNPGGYHVFVIKAVDDQGASSPVLSQAFTSYTVAPSVKFIAPKQDLVFPPIVTPTSTFRFTGEDPDGRTRKTPVKFKYKLFTQDNTEFPFLYMLVRPDSMRRFYAPNFSTWDSIETDTCEITLYHMTPLKQYVLAVVAYDEAGAYSPVFGLEKNMLFFTCQYTGREGPKIQLTSEYFTYTFPGIYDTDPQLYFRTEVPAGTPIHFSWVGLPYPGNQMRRYRWSQDIARLDDETPRTNEHTDVTHWSAWSLFGTTATLGPFAGGTADAVDEHLFYIEAEDNNGLRSLAVVQMRAVRPDYHRDVLFVDDTRFVPDVNTTTQPDTIFAPGGVWPSAAELDTFLFARGGVRWRFYPEGTLSSPGIFRGYSYDTVGTRGLTLGTVPLSVLAQYRTVVWYTDQAPTINSQGGSIPPPSDPRFPSTSMRWMNEPGRLNTLSLYSHMGGNVWLMGGGAAHNSLAPYNVTSNDAGGPIYKSGVELNYGRMMWGLPHWRSEIGITKRVRATRNPRPNPEGISYSDLPALLVERGYPDNPDPVPPLRGAGTFYSLQYEAELLLSPNVISEDVDPDPDVDRQGAVLDTIYYGGEETFEPVMTLYRGSETAPVVFSGFPLWHFRRAQAIQLADFVLQRIFHLTRQPLDRAPRP